MDLSKATNVLDWWIGAATRSLTHFVREEMGAYRLYTVVPRLVEFIESLTNIYVRYNRTRLKGRGGADDCKFALASLFDVLLTVCKVGAILTGPPCNLTWIHHSLPCAEWCPAVNSLWILNTSTSRIFVNTQPEASSSK